MFCVSGFRQEPQQPAGEGERACFRIPSGESRLMTEATSASLLFFFPLSLSLPLSLLVMRISTSHTAPVPLLYNFGDVAGGVSSVKYDHIHGVRRTRRLYPFCSVCSGLHTLKARAVIPRPCPLSPLSLGNIQQIGLAGGASGPALTRHCRRACPSRTLVRRSREQRGPPFALGLRGQ